MATPLRFGVIGTGKIAGSFARDFAHIQGGELTAVASRRPDAAQAFAAEHGIGRSYGTYEDLAADPDIDVAYIATPHNRHADDTCLLLEHGKHVLCEKPFAINASESQRMIDTANRHDRFLMEAMWARFSPAWETAKQRFDQGAIGEARVLTADFCFPTAPGIGHRLRDPERGGGSLLDLGVYPLGLAWYLFGEPDTVDTRAVVADGIDLTTTMMAGYASGVTARLVTSIDANVSIGASLIGSTGTITWDTPFHTSDAITVHSDGESRRLETPGNGLHRQAQHLIDCIAEGRSESPIVPHDYTLAMMRRLDGIRADIGLRYPSED